MKKEKLEEIIKHQKKIIGELEDTIIKYDIEINRIHKENKQLKERVNKAIEEIRWFELQADHLNDDVYLDKTLSTKLLEILKGSDK